MGRVRAREHQQRETEAAWKKPKEALTFLTLKRKKSASGLKEQSVHLPGGILGFFLNSGGGLKFTPSLQDAQATARQLLKLILHSRGSSFRKVEGHL